MKTVTIYTDGACSGNPGPGGCSGGAANLSLWEMPPKAAKGDQSEATLQPPVEEKCDEDSDNLHRRCVFG